MQVHPDWHSLFRHIFVSILAKDGRKETLNLSCEKSATANLVRYGCMAVYIMTKDQVLPVLEDGYYNISPL